MFPDSTDIAEKNIYINCIEYWNTMSTAVRSASTVHQSSTADRLETPGGVTNLGSFVMDAQLYLSSILYTCFIIFPNLYS